MTIIAHLILSHLPDSIDSASSCGAKNFVFPHFEYSVHSNLNVLLHTFMFLVAHFIFAFVVSGDQNFTPPRDIVHIILRLLATLITMRLLRRQVYRSDNKIARGLNTNAINTSTALVSVARSYHCCYSSNTCLSYTRWAIWMLKCAILWRKKGGRREQRPFDKLST